MKRLRPLLLAWLPPLCLLALLLYGLDTLWSKSMGLRGWAAGLHTATGSAVLDIALLACLFTVVFAVAGNFLRRHLSWFLGISLVVAQIAFIALAWPDITRSFPWGVDHSSFLFRLHEVRATFPALGGYNPWWNGGIEHFFSVTSGVHGFAFLEAPFLAFAEPHRFHGPILYFWFFVGFPWIAALSLRACGTRWPTAFIGALLVTAYNRSAFLFALMYGIVGGMTTAGLTLPLVALSYRLVVQRRGGWGSAALLGVVAWLSCLWTPGVFTCAGIAAAALANYRRWTRRSFARMLLAAGLALVLLAPWLWVTFIPSRSVVEFVGNATRTSAWAAFRGALQLCGRRLLEWHPVLLAFGLAGTLCAPKTFRRWSLPLLAVLGAALASSIWKPHSQFDRIAFQMAAAASFPASILLGRLLSSVPREAPRPARLVHAVSCGLAIAFLLFGLRVAGAHAAGDDAYPFTTASEKTRGFASWVRENVPPEGRLAFLGIMINNLGGGTVAYLPILSGREMMGDDYYTFPKGFTRRNFPPRPYRDSVEGFLAYSRAYGITHWAVWHPRYIRFCEENADHFTLATTFRDAGPEIRVYAVTDSDIATTTRFLEGEGTVEAHENRLVVEPSDPSDERLVLRYNWRDGLRCRTPGATIEPFEVDDHLRFIAIRPHGNSRVEIGYRPRWHRLEKNFDGTPHH